jgi:hypothetical protein
MHIYFKPRYYLIDKDNRYSFFIHYLEHINLGPSTMAILCSFTHVFIKLVNKSHASVDEAQELVVFT